LLRQYLLTVRTICKLALPDRLLFATSDDAPETASERRFRVCETITGVISFAGDDRAATRTGDGHRALTGIDANPS
jgi:hypothetical protein